MSTEWSFQCTDHVPAIQSHDEFTQHTEDACWDVALERVKMRPVGLVAPKATGTGWFYDNTTAFLQQHPTCNLNIVSEYGEVREIDNGPNVRPKPSTPKPAHLPAYYAWDEGFEEGCDFARNDHTPSGISIDPPENPYMEPHVDEDTVTVPVELYERMLNASRGFTSLSFADVVAAIDALPTEELRGKHH
jgi:hypothetical protein